MNVTGTGIAVAIAVVIALGFMFFGPQVFRPFTNPQTDTPAQAMATTTATSTLTMDQTNTNSEQNTAPIGAPQTLAGGLMVTDEVIGTGAEAKAGDTVAVNYVGALQNGTVFDASANHGGPFSFKLGAGQVIKGWDEGVAGMKEGGKRHLVIPAALAYGNQAVGGVIPANATLVFEVELVKVQ